MVLRRGYIQELEIQVVDHTLVVDPRKTYAFLFTVSSPILIASNHHSGFGEERALVRYHLSFFTPKELTPQTSSAIIQDIMELQKAGQATVAYFYFGFKDTQKQDLRNALASLLTQLSARSDRFCDILCHVHKAHNNGKYQPSNKTMITCLNDMLALSGQGPVYIILDALDECPNTSGFPTERGEVLNFLTDLVGAKLSNLRLCVTSRPETDIQAALKPLAFRALSIHDQKGQKKDIEDYIRFAVYARSNTAMGRWRVPDKELAINTLSDKADGM